MLLRTLLITLLAAASGGVTSTAPPPILFAADNQPALSGDIFRLDANGHRVNLTHTPFVDDYPLVSPDGRRIAFQSDRSGAPGVYVVGIDGRGLQRLDRPPHQIGGSSLEPELAWSPNGRLLAAVTGNAASTLRILRAGHAPTVVTSDRNFLFGPSWSPDGHLVTVQRGPDGDRFVDAYTPAGRLAWNVRYALGVTGWSLHGLFGVVDLNGLRVYDERGHKRFGVRARVAAWAPDGTRIADVVRGALEVRTSSGRLLLRKQVRGLDRARATLAWIDSRRVLVSFYPRVVGLDTATAKAFAGSIRYFEVPRSPDGRLLAETVRHGSTFAVETSPLPHGRARVYGHVGGCLDDGVLGAALTSLQFVPGRRSLVYQSLCGEPFAALYGVNPGGSGVIHLAQRPEDERSPARSPDGSQLAYTRFDAVGTSCKGCPGSLMVAAADGSSPHVIAIPQESAGYYEDSGASWSPNGTRLLYTEWNFSEPPRLLVVPAAGGPPIDLHVSGEGGAWGPTRIAYLDAWDDPPSLWTALPDGTDRQKLTNVPRETLSGRSLAWSADGRLAYAEAQTGGILIFSGAVEQHVQVPFRDLRSIDWSPDGTRFVVVGLARGAATYDVYSMRTDGTDVRRLTRNVDAYSASWR